MQQVVGINVSVGHGGHRDRAGCDSLMEAWAAGRVGVGEFGWHRAPAVGLMHGPCMHTQEVYKPPQISSKHRGIPLLNTKVAWHYSCNNSCYFKGFFMLCNTTSSSKICSTSWLPALLAITWLQPVATGLWPVEKFPVRCMDRDWKLLKTHCNQDQFRSFPVLVLVQSRSFSSPMDQTFNH